MKNRKPQKPDPQSVSTEAGLAATTRYPSGRPIGGETFLLTSPFIERFWRSAASGASISCNVLLGGICVKNSRIDHKLFTAMPASEFTGSALCQIQDQTTIAFGTKHLLRQKLHFGKSALSRFHNREINEGQERKYHPMSAETAHLVRLKRAILDFCQLTD